MIPLRGLPLFLLGACAGYGAALLFQPGPPQGTNPLRTEQASATATERPQPPPAPVRQQAPPLPPPDPHRKRDAPSRSEAAYTAQIRAAIEARDLPTALDRLASAERHFGTSAPRLILLAEVHRLRNRLSAARATLHRALAADPAMAGQIHPLLREVVTALAHPAEEALTFDEKVQLLSEEIINDPGFATYYQLLGQLHYHRGNYADAITNLEYALQLDHTRAARLSPLISAARERLANPGPIELPISPHGRALDVAVRLNDRPQPFRFILDTGASYTAISTRTAHRLGIVIPSASPLIPVSTANGTVRVPLITLDAIRLQGALVTQVPTIVLKELNGFDGLLGLSFLNHFNIDINQDEGKLFLLTPSTDR